MTSGPFSGDFRDAIVALTDAGARFLLVGGHAVAHHGHVRTTLDLDILVRPDADNALRVFAALSAFGAPLAQHGVSASDFAKPGVVYQIGLPPRRIDVLTSIAAIDFDDAWGQRSGDLLDGREIWFIGRDALIRNKHAAGRKKDLADAAALEAVRDREQARRKRGSRPDAG